MPIIFTLIALIAVVGGAIYFMNGTESPTTPAPATTEVRPITEEVVAEVPEATDNPTPARDLTPDESIDSAAANYTAEATYLTPARTSHQITVALTIANAIVTEANVIYDNGQGFSNPNQERFDGAYKAAVIGKSLNEISLSRVGGASLTSEAFNRALADIAAQISS